jgi:hypothetical protein
MSLISTGVAFVLLVAGSGVGQDKKNTPDDKKDPQAKFEPRSKPGEGQKFLEKFVGDWEVVKTMHRGGDPARTKGECRQTMVNEGRFLLSDFTFHVGEARMLGKSMVGFEPASGLFTSVWTDSRATRMSFRQSKEKFNGKEIVLHARTLAEGEKARNSWTVTRLEDEGRKIVHRQYTEGEGGKGRLVMELVLTPKAKPAPPGK